MCEKPKRIEAVHQPARSVEVGQHEVEQLCPLNDGALGARPFLARDDDRDGIADQSDRGVLKRDPIAVF